MKLNRNKPLFTELRVKKEKDNITKLNKNTGPVGLFSSYIFFLDSLLQISEGFEMTTVST